MKTLAVISFTKRGSLLAGQLKAALERSGLLCEAWGMGKYAQDSGVLPLEETLQQWTSRMFGQMEGILFIGAAGIAVRAIAPWVKDKTKDPAVLVMDEKGMFIIPLLSGHIGGANELAGMLANLTGAIPVITTATDVNGRFAVDVFAKKQNLYICNMKLAKEISADILDEKKIGFYSDFPVIGEIPEELQAVTQNQVFEGSCGICISLDERKKPFKKTLNLIPRIVTAGIGCKKGTPAQAVEEKLLESLEEQSLSMRCLEKVCSIDLKAEEPGILKICEKYGLLFETFTPEQLNSVPGEFEESEFVRSVTGTGNVCERSALAGCGGGVLINTKKAGGGVTTALAVKKWSVDFE